MPTAEQTLIDLCQRLLESIDNGDWAAYTVLCDETLSAFEPEAEGHLVEGMPFHKFYFELPPATGPRQSSISSPHVRIAGDAAIVCYTRLIQKLDADGAPVSAAFNETRVWRRDGDAWKHIHFHRSPA